MTEPIRDLAHLSHVELLTPKPDESLFYFREILGMEIAGESGDSVYLRGFGDYERSSLKLTARRAVGRRAPRVPHATAPRRSSGGSRRSRRPESRATGSTATSVTARAYSFLDPDGHRLELFYESERYAAPPELRPALKNQPQRYPGRGVGVRHLDHVNFLAVDPGREPRLLRGATSACG